MKRKNIVGLIAIVAIVAGAMFAGCVEEEQLSTAEIKAMALATADNIDTYKFDMNMTQDMLISNATNDMEMMTISTGKGVADNKNKKMKMDLTTQMELPDGATQDTVEMQMDMYFVNNVMYMKMDMGIPEMPVEWTKMEMPEGYEESWESQNQVALQMELLSVSEVELLEDETVNGVECYVLNISIDAKKYWQIVMKQEGMSELMQGLRQNVSSAIGEMMKEMSMKYWIAKETKFPMKTQMQIKMVMSSEELNIPEQEEAFTMTLDQRTVMEYYDYNEPVTIELPEEAESAVGFPVIMTPPLE